MKKTLSLIFLVCFLSVSLFGQNNHQNLIRPNGISLKVGGSSLLFGLSYDHQISNRSNIDFTLGSGVGIGYKYFINDPSLQRINFYLGISTLYEYISFVGFNYYNFGITYNSKHHFEYGFNLGILHEAYWGDQGEIRLFPGNPLLGPWLELKAGYRFSEVSNPKGERNTIHSINAEIGGVPIFYSIRYDLNKKLTSSGLKISYAPGFSYWNFEKAVKHTLFPQRLTVLYGNNLNAEAGVDLPVGFYSHRSFLHHIWLTDLEVYAFPYLGLRYQERTTGIVLKMGVVYIQNDYYLEWMKYMLFWQDVDIRERKLLFWPSVSIGYTFRY